MTKGSLVANSAELLIANQTIPWRRSALTQLIAPCAEGPAAFASLATNSPRSGACHPQRRRHHLEGVAASDDVVSGAHFATHDGSSGATQPFPPDRCTERYE